MSTKSDHAGPDFKKEDLRIRELDRLWGEAATAKNVKAVVAFYAPDATLVWPGTPPVHGTSAITQAWTGMVADIDNLSLRFEVETISFSADGQFATDFGKVIFGQNSNPFTHTVQQAKYLVVWKKVNDSWKVLYDCYNLNA